jgi:DNA-binding winged helix-turn-helix (wHTH) protein
MPPTDCYRFGDFLLCPSTRELRRGGERIALPAKSFECIVYLVAHRERAVGRDELVSAVWGRAEVGESVLNQTVLHARRALGDAGRAQNVIRTVVGFGYHWVAPTEAVVAPPDDRSAGESATSATPPKTDNKQRRGYRLAVLFAMLAATAIATIVFVAMLPGKDRAAAPKSHDAVVVLPVASAEAADTAWLRLGMMDLIANRLRENGATVVPSDNVVALARAFDTHDREDLDRLAAAVGARLVLQPRATETQAGWEVELASARGPALSVRANASDPLDAALAATNLLGAKLGLSRSAITAADGEPSLRTLIQRIKAATLSDDLDEARRLAAQATPEQRADPELRFRIAKVDAQAGRATEAEAALRTLLSQVGAEHDPRLRARILDALGVLALQRNAPAAAERLHDEAIDLLAASGNEGQLGKSFGNRAAARFAQHRDEDAMRDFARARGALENAGDTLSLTFLDANLGAMDMLRDRYREAAEIFERAATRLEAMRVYYAALNGWDAAAQSRLLLLEPAAAARIEPRLRDLAGRVADPRLRLGAALTRAEILAANGSVSEARTLLAQSRAELEHADVPPSLAGRADAIAARFELAASNAAGAADDAAAAFDRLVDADDARERVRNWLVLVRAGIASGDVDAAAASLRRIEQRRDAAPTHAARIYASIAAAELALARGDEATARAAFDAALDDAVEGRVPIDILEAAGALAGWLIKTGDLAAASAVVERVTPWAGQSYEASLLQLRLYHAAGLASAWATALDRTRGLAGERPIPAAVATPPG